VVVDAVKLGLRRLGRKTDRRDALEIARRLRLGDLDNHAKTYYPSEAEYGARKLERVRHRLVRLRLQVINQIRGLLNAYKLACPGTSLYTGPSLRRLRALDFRNAEVAACRDALADSLETIQVSIATLSARIRAHAVKLQELQAMVPGLGPQSAVTVVAELGDPRRFRNARAVASYAGLVPKVANSADTAHHGRLTKRGNRELRWILGQCAVRLLACDEGVQAWAAPLLKRMHKNKVRMALARRLLVGIYATLCRGEVFCLDRCLGRAA
jgi:transposase